MLRACRVRLSNTVARATAPPVSFVRDGQQFVNVSRYTHPVRGQTVMLVPAPRFASKRFYDSWVYQPYPVENSVVYSTDCMNLLGIAAVYSELSAPEAEYTYLHWQRMPSSASMNLDRATTARKLRGVSFPLYRLVLPVESRDKHHPWIVPKTRKALEVDSVKPSEELLRVVLIFPPSQASTLAQYLRVSGFELEEEVEVEVGNHEVLQRLNARSAKGEMVILGYIYLLIVLNVGGAIVGAWNSYASFRDAKLAERQNEH
jgi:hypothetical protein